jgi:small subunit ribosomal protein S1
MTEDINENKNQEEENFEQLLNESFAHEKQRLSPGEKIEAPIVSIGNEWTLLGIGGKGEGFISTDELKDKEGNLYVSVGDTIRAYFLKTENGEMHFTTQVTGPAARTMLHDAMEEHIPLEGTITKDIKGGFEVTLTGGSRAFCPFSHMGIRRDANKQDYIGRVMNFYVIEVKGRSATLSRKEIVAADHEAVVKELKETLNLGDKVHGRVTSIPVKNFGAFIDFGGGVEGLLPISEISWERTKKVEDVLKVGQEVDVIVKSIDWENEEFSLSLRDTLPNPWDSAAENFPVGSYHTGKVCRLAQFGAFVNLAPTIDGLIHISKLGGDKRIQHPGDVLTVGQEIEVKVEKVDMINKRISLVPAAVSRAEDEKTETITKYTENQEKEDFGGLGALGEALKKAKEEKGSK